MISEYSKQYKPWSDCVDAQADLGRGYACCKRLVVGFRMRRLIWSNSDVYKYK